MLEAWRKATTVFRLHRLRILAVFAIACSPACDTFLEVEGSGGPLMRTDSTTYTLSRRQEGGWQVRIPFTYENRTGGRVYVLNCLGAVPPNLERLRDGSWELAWSSFLPDCGSPPVIIDTDQTYLDTLHVVAWEYGSRKRPQFTSADVEGTYRLRWDDGSGSRAFSSFDYVRFRPHAGTEIPLEYRVSNEFALSVQR